MNSDEQNARIEHDKALSRVMTAVLEDDTELFKQFSDNEGFRKWLTDTVFALTYAPRHSARAPVRLAPLTYLPRTATTGESSFNLSN